MTIFEVYECNRLGRATGRLLAEAEGLDAARLAARTQLEDGEVCVEIADPDNPGRDFETWRCDTNTNNRPRMHVPADILGTYSYRAKAYLAEVQTRVIA